MTQSTTLRAIPFLFDRPSEPLFLPRDNVTFDVPTDYWVMYQFFKVFIFNLRFFPLNDYLSNNQGVIQPEVIV